jgi:hypothetical protein
MQHPDGKPVPARRSASTAGRGGECGGGKHARQQDQHVRAGLASAYLGPMTLVSPAQRATRLTISPSWASSAATG